MTLHFDKAFEGTLKFGFSCHGDALQQGAYLIFPVMASALKNICIFHSMVFGMDIAVACCTGVQSNHCITFALLCKISILVHSGCIASQTNSGNESK